jgi:hypothetical protein
MGYINFARYYANRIRTQSRPASGQGYRSVPNINAKKAVNTETNIKI